MFLYDLLFIPLCDVFSSIREESVEAEGWVGGIFAYDMWSEIVSVGLLHRRDLATIGAVLLDKNLFDPRAKETLLVDRKIGGGNDS